MVPPGHPRVLATRRTKSEKVFNRPLLVLFSGLFIVAGVEKTTLERDLLALAQQFRLDRTAVPTAFSAPASNIVSNVPAALVFRPVVLRLADPHQGWLTRVMSSTLAGKLTILGSVANLIVVERARKQAAISFCQYLRVGTPVTVLTLAFGVLWLSSTSLRGMPRTCHVHWSEVAALRSLYPSPAPAPRSRRSVLHAAPEVCPSTARLPATSR